MSSSQCLPLLNPKGEILDALASFSIIPVFTVPVLEYRHNTGIPLGPGL